MAGRTLVLGIGNTLLGDEGVGVHVVRQLQALLPESEELEFLDGGTLSFTLATPIEAAARLIVVDAAELDADAGTVRVFENEAMDRFLGHQRKRSVHEVGLMDLLAIARLTETLPAHRALIGIQPEFIDWSETPSAPVAQAIPRACAAAQTLIERWRQ
jgi:hydrogenase maturation protease